MRTVLLSLLALLCIASCDRYEPVGNSGVFIFEPEEVILGAEGGVAVSYAKGLTKLWNITAYVDGELFFKIDVRNESGVVPYTRKIGDYCTIIRPEKERVEVHLPPRSEGNFQITIGGEGVDDVSNISLMGGLFTVNQIVTE